MVACWMKSPRRLANQRGMAIGVVLLILVLVLLMGLTLIGVSVTENQAGSIVADMKKAFSAAETGIQEAMYRMRLDPASYPNESNTTCSATADPVVIGSVQGGAFTVPNPDPTSLSFWKYNPLACSWAYAGSNATGYGNYFGGIAANLDSAGRTFTSSGSSHATGGALVKANLANGASYAVTVAPVVGFAGGCWQYVNQSGTPLGSCSTVATNPMFKVTSIGTARDARKTLSAMIQHYNINPKLDGTISAHASITVQSAAARIDGHNFDCNGNNPSNTDSVNAATVPSKYTVSVNKPQNLQCSAGTGTTNCAGTSTPLPSTFAAYLLGPNPSSADINDLDAYLASIQIAPASAPTSVFHGVVYINGNYTKPPDGSTGVLIVHNASNTANLGNFNGGNFKGLIIADQMLVSGSAQIIGGVVTVASVSTGEGTPSVDYSKCIVDGLAKYFPLHIVRGTWHEQ